MRGRTKRRRSLLGLVLLTLLAGCHSTPNGSGAGGTAAGGGRKVFYWIQPLKGHPTHQMTQLGFQEGCRKVGYPCEIVGTDTYDVPGTIALAEQVLAKGDAAGMAVWAGTPAWNAFIEKASKEGVPVILPHFPAPEGSVPGAVGVIGFDTSEVGREAAEEIGKAIGGNGTVALTQATSNTTENEIAQAFTETMKAKFPQVKVLEPQLEGLDPPKAIAIATAILQGHPEVNAAFSTTGAGTITWAGAQKEAHRKIIAVGVNYTRDNLDLVKDGEIYGVIGQPLWEESVGAAQLLAKAVKKEKIPWFTKLPAPFIGKNDLAPYYDLLNTKVEPSLRR